MAADLQVRRHTITTVDGVGLAVEEYGSADAEHTVYFWHGLCLSKLAFMPQITLLRRRFGDAVRMVAVDHRGHGHSGSAAMASYTIAQLGRDVATVLAEIGGRGSCTLVGHSMGGMALLEYLRLPASWRPVDPDALVLVGTAAGRLAERGAGRLLGLPLLGALAEVVEHTHHGDRAVRTLVRPVCRTVGRVCGLCDSDRDTLTATVANAVYTTPLTTAVGFLPSLKSYDAYGVLATITARTTVISGGADLLTPPAHARDLAAGIDGATHRHLPAAGHMLLHEAPHVVANEIARTITAATGASRHAVSGEVALAAGALAVAQ